MQIIAEKSFLSGELQAPPSKSMAHRVLLCSLLSKNKTIIENLPNCQDISVMLSAVKTLGLEITNRQEFCPPVEPSKSAVIDCGECGTALRFLICVLSALNGNYRLTGSRRLLSRPIMELVSELNAHGAVIESFDDEITVSGKLKAGKYFLPGNVSSQFVSGLLIALAFTEGESEIELLTPLSSSSYTDMTLSVLKTFGVNAERIGEKFFVRHSDFIAPPVFRIEGDWSNSAFWIVGATLNGNLKISGLDVLSDQGDKRIIETLRCANANCLMEKGVVSVKKSVTSSIEIDIDQIPDLVPAIAVLCANSEGISKIKNVERLKYKESDRILSVISLINSIGGKASYRNDEITIYGKKTVGGVVDCFFDHRIAMAALIAAVGCERSVTINGAESLNKSYPDFMSQYVRLGGITNVGMDRK